MKKLILVLILLFTSCSTPKEETPEFVGLGIDELIEVVKDENANQLKGEIFYNIFPISFADSNGDGFGDLQGIIKSLDYLKEMGVKGLWLNPIHPSPSYHKYDVLDYYEIDEQFGTLDDFKALIKEVHKRDMVLIMDMVINHSSSQHPWFIKSMNNEEGYQDYYIKAENYESIPSADKSAWYQKNNQYYFGSFWSEMPEFNLESEAVRLEFRKILKYWLDLGVDGFRYDAAKHAYDQNEYAPGTPTLKKNLQFWLEMKAYVKYINPKAYTVAEIWMDNRSMSYYGWAFDALFNFDFGQSVIASIRDNNTNSFLGPYIKGQNFFKNFPYYLDATFLSNHDQPRIGSQIQNQKQLQIASSILLTMPGNPYIYYGEELGYFGVKPDEQIREPYKWDGYNEIDTPTWEDIQLNKSTSNVDVQINNTDSLLNHYRKWGTYRSQSEILKEGDFLNLSTNNNKILAYTRTLNNQTLLVIHNMNHDNITIDLGFKGTVELASHNKNSINGSDMTLYPTSSMIIKVTP